VPATVPPKDSQLRGKLFLSDNPEIEAWLNAFCLKKMCCGG
jgi:hypothetical protein